MFELNRVEGAIEQIKLSDTRASSHALLAPSRGGMISRWNVAGREVLYLDEATFVDGTKNVRGGNPVLFPSPGKLTGDAWSRGGKGGQLKQHGFARNLPWRVVEQGTDNGASITLALSSDEGTRAPYPFEFEAKFRYTLRDNELSLAMSIANTGGERMPFGVGFHPYFAVAQGQKGQTTIESNATRALDNTTKREVDYALDLTSGEVDLHLLDHGATRSTLRWPGGVLSMEGSPEFTHWVIWTLPGKDFVCLEPWTCPGDALNSGARLLELAPGESRDLWLRMRFEAS